MSDNDPQSHSDSAYTRPGGSDRGPPGVRKPGILSRIGSGLTRVRLILSNVLFFGFLILLLMLLFSGTPVPDVPSGGALVLNPRGAIVEERSPVDPIQQWLTPSAVLAETELTDVLDALEHAREDARIDMVVLDLDELQFVSVAHASAIGEAIGAFRESGKQVVAYGSYYDQQPYLIASYADAVYMHPMGQVLIPGYSIRQLYFKELLDKLNVNVHVFRVGKYKEFVEPYTRDDMSESAEEANLALVETLWQHYGEEIRGNRELDGERFERYTQSYATAVQETAGDFARLAVEYHLVDELLTPDQARARVADVVGRGEHGDFRGIGFRDYLQAVNGEPKGGRAPQVAVITGQGPIVMGNQLRGVIAAERVVQTIREVRENDRIGALVVRLNTPGGSAFASELIRQELELTQLAGKPVVISMGPLAASGGYWISATADAIVAEPSTLTGSIGVFGIVPSFEKSLAAVGVNSDGVQTTPLSAVNPLTGLSDATRRMLQVGTEQAYQQFLNLVARGRDLSLDQVDALAQGRVWLGSQALELGLVDTLGGQEQAIARAAELAGLEDYGVQRLEPPLTPQEMLLRQLFGTSAAAAMGGWLGLEETGTTLPPVVRQMREAWQMLGGLNDPRHNYALCLSCDAL